MPSRLEPRASAAFDLNGAQFYHGPVGAVPALPIGALFAEMAAARGEAIAIVADAGALSYAELDRRSNRLARHLIARGVGAETMVALAMPRSTDMIVALLAILKAGGAYLPLDPKHPARRSAWMIRDSVATLILAYGDSAAALVEADADLPPVLTLDAPDIAEAIAACSDAAITDTERGGALAAESLAYVIYTSGSTGTPKGAAVTHANVVNLAWRPSYADIGADDVVLQAAPVAFDASTFEIWGALLNGARLALAPEPASDLELLAEAMARHRVTIAWFTAGLFAEIVAHHLAMLGGLKQLLIGGDVLSVPAVARVLAAYPALRVTNGYGPTETTTFACAHDIAPGDLPGPIPIGRPIRNATVAILDPRGAPSQVGMPGELHIAGAGVSRGYRGQPELTAERFVPGAGSSRYYRTGDLAAWRADGTIDFLGRSDDQVKLRGFRIEPGEIEAALLALPGIAQASVQPRAIGGETRLVAYLVASDDAMPDVVALRGAIGAVLPDYMVPSAFVRLERLPLTSNGKIDRRALPEPVLTGRRDRRAPRDDDERLLCRLFAEITGTTGVGIDDDFVAIGGHSLGAMRLVARLREAGRAMRLADIFRLRTPEALAAVLTGPGDDAMPLVPGAGFDGGVPALSIGQLSIWVLEQIDHAPQAYNIPLALDLRGPLDDAALRRALGDVIERHLPLRTAIATANGVPCGRLFPAEGLGDLLPVEAVADEAVLADRLRAEAGRRFDLARAPLVRARLYRLSTRHHVLSLVLHHGAVDGESLPLLFGDLTQAYAARREGQVPDFASLPASYPDFAAWQRDWLAASGEEARQLAWWRAQLTGMPTALDLPTDFTRNPHRSRTSGEQRIAIPPEQAAMLRRAATDAGTTLFAVLLAAWVGALGRICDTSDLAIGIPVAGRERPELAAMVGYFANTLPVRFRTGADPDLETLLAQVADTLVEALSHADAPFARIVEEVGARREPDRTPFFQAAFTWQGQPLTTGAALPGLSIGERRVASAKAKFDLSLSLHPAADGGVAGALEYDASLFQHARVEHWVSMWRDLLGALGTDVSRRLSQVLPAGSQSACRDLPLDAADARSSISDPSVIVMFQRLFAEVIGAGDLGPDDDFFLSGGHSLAAVRLVARARAAGLALPVSQMFLDPTPRGCAAAARPVAEAFAGDRHLVALQPLGDRRPLFCVHGIGGNVFNLRHLAARLGTDRPILGLRAVAEDPDGEGIEALAERYVSAIREHQPAGPYLLAGYSLGGLIAFEMARQLRARGEEIQLLAILDARWPATDRLPAGRFAAAAYWLGNLPGLVLHELRHFSPSRVAVRLRRVAGYAVDKLLGRITRVENFVDLTGVAAEDRRLFGSHLQAVLRYAPVAVRLPVELFRARVQSIRTPWRERTMGWFAVGGKAMRVHVIPGNHLTMLTDAPAALLAARLAEALERADPN